MKTEMVEATLNDLFKQAKKVVADLKVEGVKFSEKNRTLDFGMDVTIVIDRKYHRGRFDDGGYPVFTLLRGRYDAYKTLKARKDGSFNIARLVQIAADMAKSRREGEKHAEEQAKQYQKDSDLNQKRMSEELAGIRIPAGVHVMRHFGEPPRYAIDLDFREASLELVKKVLAALNE